MTIRLAILECDTPMPDVLELYGRYGEHFQRLFAEAAGKESMDVSYTKHDVVEQEDDYPELANTDGIVISGSKHSAFEDTPWILRLVEWVRQAMEKGVKVVAICFGHQIASRALGAVVDRSSNGWELAVTGIELTPLGRKFMPNIREKLQLQQMHRDVVTSIPPGAELLCSNRHCQTQGFYIKGRLLSFQGHPEFIADVVDRIIVTRERQSIFPKDVAENARQRVNLRNDGVEVARAALQFVANSEL